MTSALLVAVDVHYEDRATTVACVGFESWEAQASSVELVLRDETAPSPYEPGQFFKRELPHVLRALEVIRARRVVETVVIDAHVWLDRGTPGLGAHLYDALGKTVAVIGVAKSVYRDGVAIGIVRGASKSPLLVSAAGIDVADAAKLVRAMHGPHRLPTLLKRVDQLARGIERPDPAKR